MDGKMTKEMSGQQILQRPPTLKGFHLRQAKRQIFTALGLVITAGTLFYLLYNRRRKQNYAKFYANYDAEASFQRMHKAGLFQSTGNYKESEKVNGANA